MNSQNDTIKIDCSARVNIEAVGLRRMYYYTSPIDINKCDWKVGQIQDSTMWYSQGGARLPNYKVDCHPGREICKSAR